MEPPGADTVLVRCGDLSTKSESVRGRMEADLIEHLEALLDARGVDGRVERRRLRPLVHTSPDDVATAAAAAADVYGVVSASAALAVAPDRDAIVDALARTAEACYDGGSFAVDARRATDDVPFDSPELEEFGGAAVWDAVDFEPEVDLEDPDVTFGVEVRHDRAYVHLGAREGPGGLPVGSQEPLVALISGGIDSPVAAHEAMRRGAPVIPLYVDLGSFGGPDHRARAAETARTLAGRVPHLDASLRVVEAGDDVAWIAEHLEKGRMLALRRYMLRAAAAVADETGAVGVVTGEALGQKSSQTATNLAVTDAATDLPVHRPLFAWDKSEVVDRARDLGTFEDATVDAGCNRVAPDRPVTGTTLDRQREREPDGLLERATRAGRAATD